MQQFRYATALSDLAEEVKRYGPEHNYTRLVPDLSAGEDPDDAFSRVRRGRRGPLGIRADIMRPAGARSRAQGSGHAASEAPAEACGARPWRAACRGGGAGCLCGVVRAAAGRCSGRGAGSRAWWRGAAWRGRRPAAAHAPGV